MNSVINANPATEGQQQVIKALYEAYAVRLLAYTRRHYTISEDDAMGLVYKTIYRMAGVSGRYSFESPQKQAAFVFKTHINYLRNYFRDNRAFENKNREVTLDEFRAEDPEQQPVNDPKLLLLQRLLDNMEEWQRILLLMRGQDIPYGEIARFVDKPEKQLKVYYARLKKQLLSDMNDLLNHADNGKK